MILDNSGSTVTTVGDLQENQVSIDKGNLEHIVTILSTNLYSLPEQSFLREIVSNAIDAQVEAKSNEPAIISLAWDGGENKYVVAIRDFGTGLSPERFKEIFLNIGSSTKRESNDYIGSFGIGRFSSLACANMVHITSYYNGIRYYYLMLRNGGKINIDLLETTPTEEPNGVEIKIKVDWLYAYTNALPYLWFIPNVYVHSALTGSDSKSQVDRFNNRQLFYYKNFAYNNVRDDNFVLSGSILYPVDLSRVELPEGVDYSSDKDVLKVIIPKFEIGELEVTPNREQLQYTDRTKRILAERYAAAIEELKGLCAEVSKREFSNLFEFYEEITCEDIVIALPHKNLPEGSIRLVVKVNKKSFLRPYIKYSYNNDPLATDPEILSTIRNFRMKSVGRIFSETFVFANGRYMTQKMMGRSAAEVKYLLTSGSKDVRIFFVPTTEQMKSDIFKSYLKDKAERIQRSTGKDAVFILTTASPKITRLLKNKELTVCDNNGRTDIHKTLWWFRELQKMLKGHIFVYDILKSADYIRYRQRVLLERKEERKYSTKFGTKTRFYVKGWQKYYTDWRFTDKVDVENVPELVEEVNKKALDYLDKEVVPVYWGVLEDPYMAVWKDLIVNKQSFIILQVAKTNYKCLERASLPKNWFLVTPEFILKSREFRRWMTYKTYRCVPDYSANQLMRKAGDLQLLDTSERSVNFERAEFLKNSLWMHNLESRYQGYYDLCMREKYDIARKYNAIMDEMQGILDLNSQSITPLSMYAAMKRKLVRPSREVYEKILESFKPKPKVTNNEESN